MANPTGNQNNKPQNSNQAPKAKFSRGLLSWMLICFALIMMWGMINGSGAGQEITSWNDFVQRAQLGQFEDDRVTLEESRVTAIIADGSKTPAGSIDIPEGTNVYFPYGGQSHEWYLKELKR